MSRLLPSILPPRVRPGALIGLVLGAPLLLGALACGNSSLPPSDDGTGASDSGGSEPGSSGGQGAGTGGMGDGGSGPASGGSGGSGPPELPSECAATQTGSRLLRRLTRQELLNSHVDVFGSVASEASAGLPGDPMDTIRLSNDASLLTVTQDTAQAMLDRAEEIAGLITAPEDLPTNLPCAASSQDEACVSEFIERYGEELFRHELSGAEVERYLGHFQSLTAASASFSTALKWVLVGLIQSPHAVYRAELGDEGGKLSAYEVASELAYDYSASPPSAELLALALSGGLEDPEVRFQEAKKLLLTERGKDVMLRFFEEWLAYKNVLTVSRDNTPDNFETVRPKMVREMELFLDKLLLEKSGKLADLLTADFTVVDQEVASYYGFSGGSGDLSNGTGAEVERTYGLGVFGQGSVTTAMASITITSPTRRGLLLLKRLFCEVPRLPQALNFDLTRGEVEGNTTRERLENSHLAGSCQECHKDFDPLGFAFENIDNVGRYRTEEMTPNGNFPIDATAIVAKLDGLAVNGEEELMRGLAASPEVLSCISGTMARYVYGADEQCLDPTSRTRAISGETSVVDFLAELAKEPHFVERAN